MLPVETGRQNIMVTLESDQPEFFCEPWEILLTPGYNLPPLLPAPDL
ncbi:MAG: hypothetical protein ACUZ8H_09505 [Candidatus Anammoxibacter sp.]